MKKKINVCVLMGGKSPEYEISLISGKEVVKNLDSRKYKIYPVVISRDGVYWRLTSVKGFLSSLNPLSLKAKRKELITLDSREIENTTGLKKNGIDVVFIAMHGPFGEDGTIQGMLELADLKYTGSGVLASALGMDKLMFRKIMFSEGIPSPKFVEFKKGESSKRIFKHIKEFPLFVKPNNQGSSIGVSIAKTERELRKSIKNAFKYSNMVLVEEYIKGLEVTCSLLGNDKPVALPLIEIHPKKAKFFDYESKYTESGSEEIVPARISKALTLKIQDMAKRVHKSVGCRGFSRVDFILKDNKMPIVLEINTIPGLTLMSLFPKSAKSGGIPYKNLLDRIIEYSL